MSRKEKAEELANEFKTEFLNATEVADFFHTTTTKIRGAVENGTLPIGFVYDGRVVIVKQRLEAWLNGWDLLGQFNLNMGVRLSKRKENT